VVNRIDLIKLTHYILTNYRRTRMSNRTKKQPVKLMTGIGWGILGIILIVSLFSTAAFADGNEQLQITLPVYTGNYDVGVVSLGSFGLRGDATALMKIPGDAQIIAAYVYLSGYSNLPPSQLGDILVTVSNGENTVTKAAQCIGFSKDGENQCFTYRADASDVVSIGEHRYHVVSKQLPATPTSGRVYGGGLVAIYSLPSLPESDIWIADGVDYFGAEQGYPTTSTVVFPFDGNRFERYGSVKIFAGVDLQNTASAIWHKLGHGNLPTGDIIDTPDAEDYNNSSNSDPMIDSDPINDGLGVRRGWSMVEYLLPVQSEQDWAAFQLESQTDNPNKSPLSGVWSMAAFKLPREETGCGSIGDRVFYDKNSNCVRDQMERGLAAVLVSLYLDNGDKTFDSQNDTFMDSVRTNRLGFYLFQNLKEGNYFVDIYHPYMSESSFVLTTNNDPAGPIPVVDANPILDIDFGFNSTEHLPYNPVQFDSFSLQSNFDGIWLNWSTQAGTENFGFDIFRSSSESGDYSLINENVIPASNSPDGIHNYSFLDTTVEAGNTYYYQIADVTLSGESTMYGPVSVTASTTDIIDIASQSGGPGEYQLGAAYPNPFNGKTSIQFSLAKPGIVKLEVYNLMGQKIRTLVAENRAAGNHTISWDGKNNRGHQVVSGVYLYKMNINNYQVSKRILYLK